MGIDLFGEPEISELEHSLMDHDVGWLDVSVNYANFEESLDSVEEILEYLKGIIFGQLS